MPTCDRCHREFKNNSGLAAHQSRSQVCKHSEEIIEQYRNGASSRMVAEELNINPQSVYRYLQSRKLLRDHSQANEVAWDTNRFKGPDPDFTICNQFVWLVAVLLGDGSVFKTASREYIITLSVIDQEFTDEFEDALVDIGLCPSRYDTDYKKSVRACSKKFYTWWNEQTEEDLKQIAEAYPASFVRGIYDSEGGLYYQEENNSFNMTITITEKWILESVKRLTEESIGHTFHGPGYYYGEDGVGSIRLHKRDQLKDFFEWIEPTISRKGVAYMEENDRGLQQP